MKRHLLLLIAIAVAAALAVLAPRNAQALIAGHSCNYCHNVHGAPGSTLLKEAQIETLCISCHGPAGISTLKAEVHLNDRNSLYPVFRITCRQCHDPHDNNGNWLGGRNLRLVGSRQDATGYARISTPNSAIRDVVFESRGFDAGQATLHSLADADQDGNGYYDGVCETCHTLTRYHLNTAAGNHTHNTGDTCMRCHPHAGNFLK
jgi:predicted CXXCH cytochrome family protein